MDKTNTNSIIFREDLYPRIERNPERVQRYASIIGVLPPIEVNQHMELIDGWHRWTAHKKAELDEVPIVVTETKSDAEFLKLAIERNAKHGMQLSEADKKAQAVKLYAAGAGETKAEIARVLSVTPRTVSSYLTKIDKDLREQRKRRIFDLWMASHTQDEIAKSVGVSQQKIAEEIETFTANGKPSKSGKSLVFEHDQDYSPPLFTSWAYGKVTNKVGHFGNSEQRILENLLYLYTEPFDIVVDPFGGGGSTIDVCRYRLRRYWIADRKPIPEREHEIRRHDIVVDGLPPLNRNWSNVSLTYLDPPYWRQAENKYSGDSTDLANMPLDDFTKSVAGLVKGVSRKQSKGAIALLIQPTQWNAPDRETVDHIIDIVSAVGNRTLRLAYRIHTPYATEQATPQMVNWAKENKKLLVISRELLVWEVA